MVQSSNLRNSHLSVFLVLLLLGPFIYIRAYGLASLPENDLGSFYYAAQLAFVDGATPYDYAALLAAAEQTAGLEPMGFLYAPPSLLFFWPLVEITYWQAVHIVLAINTALAMILFALVLGITKQKLNTMLGLVLVGYAICFYPIEANLAQGQINLAVLALVCASWLLDRRGKADIWVAAPMALAIALKLYPSLFLLPYLIRRRYRVVAWAAGLVLALSALSAAVLPQGIWQAWLTNLLPTGGYGGIEQGILPVGDWENQSLHGVLSRLLPGSSFSGPLAYAASLALVGAYAWLCRHARHSADALDAVYALGLITMVLVSPLSWTPHLVYALPAVCLALTWASTARSTTIIVGLTALALAWRPPFVLIAHSLPTALVPLGVSEQFVALAGLFVFLSIRLYRVGAETKRPIDTLTEHNVGLEPASSGPR